MLLGLEACRDICLGILQIVVTLFNLAICWAILCISQLLSCLLTFQMCVGVILAASLSPRTHCREGEEPTAECLFNWLCIMGLWCKYQEFLSKGCWTLSWVSTVHTFSPLLLLFHFKAATKPSWYGAMQMSVGRGFEQLMAVDVSKTTLTLCFQLIHDTVDTLSQPCCVLRKVCLATWYQQFK